MIDPGIIFAGASVGVMLGIIAYLSPTVCGTTVGAMFGAIMVYGSFSALSWWPTGPWYAIFPLVVILGGGAAVGGEIGARYEYGY